MFKKLGLSILLGATLFIAPACGQDYNFVDVAPFVVPKRTDVVRDLKPLVVGVIIENGGFGTGSFIDDEGTVLTAKHVVSEPCHKVVIAIDTETGTRENVKVAKPNCSKEELTTENIYVKTDRDTSIKYKIHRVSNTHDIAILKPIGQMNKLPSWVKFRDTDLEVGEKVFTIGHPEGYKWAYGEGYVSQTNRKHDEKYFKTTVHHLELNSSQGGSGALIFDQTGKASGMLIGGQAYKQSGFRVALSIRLSDIINFISGKEY